MNDEPIIPVRLCCGKRHWTVACPDGLVMCCLCFSRVPKDQLHVDDNGTLWDVCQPCRADEVAEMERRGRSTSS